MAHDLKSRLRSQIHQRIVGGLISQALERIEELEGKKDPYIKALDDVLELLNNAKENEGGIHIGERFLKGAHWGYEIEDQLIALKDQRKRETGDVHEGD